MRLILASGSKQRKDILDMIGFKYEVIKSDIEENSNETEPDKYVEDLSRQKANAVKEQIEGDAIIISADSIIYMDGKIYEKPKTKEEAFNNIKKMSGKSSYAYTGVTIIDTYKNKKVSFTDVCEVEFKEIEDEDIIWYTDNEEHILERCGYAVLGKASIFINKIVGDHNTLFGISPSKLTDELKKIGYKLSDFN